MIMPDETARPTRQAQGQGVDVRAAFDRLLADFKGGLLFFYISTVDQASHMLWSYMDPDHPAYVADSLLAHANKCHVATLPYETKRLCQDIGGGIVETGCFPSYKDFSSPEYGELVQNAVKAGVNFSAETRARAARLIEWLTLGAGVPGCMHGGGSPDGARLVVRFRTPLEEFAEYARNIAGIKEPVPEPEKKKK